MRLELDSGKVINEFSESEYEGSKFLKLTKVTMPFKKGDKPKFKNLTIRLKNYPEVRNFFQTSDRRGVAKA